MTTPTPGDIYLGNFGAGPLRARIVAVTDDQVRAERWRQDAWGETHEPNQEFEIPLSKFLRSAWRKVEVTP